MKISELIEKLKVLQERHGDLIVYHYDSVNEEDEEICNIVFNSANRFIPTPYILID